MLIPPLAAMTPEASLPLLAGAACLVMGLAVAVLVWWVARALRTEDLQQGAEWRYDVSRVNPDYSPAREGRRSVPLLRQKQCRA